MTAMVQILRIVQCLSYVMIEFNNLASNFNSVLKLFNNQKYFILAFPGTFASRRLD